MSMTERPSDLLFEYTKVLSQQKLSGVVQDDLLSKILILEGDFIANKVKQGKLSGDEIESVRTLIPQGNYCFSYPHKFIENATKTVNESIDMAEAYLEERNERTHLTDIDNTFAKSFRL